MLESGLQAPASCVCICLQWPFRAVWYFFLPMNFRLGIYRRSSVEGQGGGSGGMLMRTLGGGGDCGSF